MKRVNLLPYLVRTAAMLVVLAFSPFIVRGTESSGLNGNTRRGATLYVSKLGDDSDGRSWKTAFHTIQKALDAVPDDRGGHCIIARPDTYLEANLAPAHKGAAGAYNTLRGDFDGRLGSGAIGWTIIDSGDPQKGFKSWDWWGPIRASDKHWPHGNNQETFSSMVWDRWTLRYLYTAGGDGGFFWDLTNKSGAPFTVVVEDCVGTGRAFGGGVAYPIVRPGEPSVFRRCYFLALDWLGDAAAVLVGGWEKAMPEYPHVVFEDCTLVHSDNAVAISYASRCARARFVNCRLIVLNFTQPEMGGKSTGIVCTQGHAPTGRLHVDLEDCVLAGYSVFTSGEDRKAVTYTTKGRNKAYVQFKQEVPAGFERLGLWPADLFARIAPPRSPTPSRDNSSRPSLTKLPFALPQAMENTPLVFQGRPLHVLNYRDDTQNNTDGYTKSMYLYILDLTTGAQVCRFGEGHSFANAFGDGSQLHVFASEGTNRDWFQSLYHFSTRDLKTWKRELAIPKEGSEHLFNASVCRDEKGFLMAYESNQPVQFCFKFARSGDLSRWEKVPGLVFTGVNHEYSACPVLRYVAPYYYVIYTHAPIPGHKGYISFLARSQDLALWELSPFNPILEAGAGEGINNSDVDLFEWEGKTYVTYATGDQATWGAVRAAFYDGPVNEFFLRHFPAGVPTMKANTRSAE
ncbi:MAG: hypothetical protein M1376_16910 [Planctomycetes bacterium]|nr:hypothetical protein [Planctomycetota bacterium]